jgi:pyruvate dehydrogenase E1 component
VLLSRAFITRHLRPRLFARPPLKNKSIISAAKPSGKGLSSYPHPWLMPDFWQFPTVSMGLGTLAGDLSGALHEVHRTIAAWLQQTATQSLGLHGRWRDGRAGIHGRIGVAGRERLDNLVFVINCNLQRLDGPVRGNGKIIQELESEFRGSGWNVIKVDLGLATGMRCWRSDKTGLLHRRMMEVR